MTDPFLHCEQLVREGDKDRFLATLFAPADRRGALFALYAFNLEIARIREVVHEPMPGEIRMRWWADVLEGKGQDTARGNPIAAALLDTIGAYRLPLDPLLDLIEARSFDLYDDPVMTLSELNAYAQRTSSALIGLAATILGDVAPEVGQAAGIAYAVTSLLRAFALHSSRGQLYVPVEILERHSVAPADVFAGRVSEGLKAALADMQDHARRKFDEFNANRATLPRSVLPAFLPTQLVPLYLARMQRRDYAPFLSVVEVPQWRRQWVMWRAS
ncbi:MAG TPA: phytoene/squalene synthase family protein [Xanthobacteraceae bacterium]|jgi:phytoene synthase|nr:phytoene/squalene synthase family protein [Xanthobacteraceae bacterium]